MKTEEREEIEKLISMSNYHPMMEMITDAIANRTDNHSCNNFLRTVTSFKFAQMASSMRASIISECIYPTGFPINMFACCLMPSGSGKGWSLGILEDEIVGKFVTKFCKEIVPSKTTQAIDSLATDLSITKGISFDDAVKEVTKECDSYGSLPYQFDSSTEPAFRQVRNRAVMCDIGATSVIVDEIGSNWLKFQELYTICLENYDTGKGTRGKVIKNSSTNIRYEERFGAVPCNLLWFGTPDRLLDNGEIENTFRHALTEGYARRMLFGIGYKAPLRDIGVEELIKSTKEAVNNSHIEEISKHFGSLADSEYYKKVIKLEPEQERILLLYKLYCEERSLSLNSHSMVERDKANELKERYSKVAKLAGAYAFVDKTSIITTQQLLNAIKLVEDSGESLNTILDRDPPHIVLAKYLSDFEKPLTEPEICKDLPFYNTTELKRKDLLKFASAWGYNNSIMIKRSEIDGITLLEGRSLERNDLNKLIVSISADEAYQYTNGEADFDKLVKIVTQTELPNWVNHHLKPDATQPHLGCRRKDDYVIPGFNLVVLDIDNGVSIKDAQDILKDYTYILYTTKRHTEASPRFRVVLPLLYKLFLSKEDYGKFMKNIYDSLPFAELDTATKDRCRKWLSNDGEVFTNQGELFDPRPYVPNTAQCENREKEEKAKKLTNLDHVDKWFLNQLEVGNRNNLLYRYMKMLVDTGHDITVVKDKVYKLNERSSTPLERSEIEASVLSRL